MRTLSQSMRGNPATNRQQDIEQNDRITSLENRASSLENDVQSINTRLDDTNINKSSGTIGNLHSTDATITNVNADTVSADIVNAREANVDSIDTTSIDTSTLTALTSVNAPIVNASNKVETVDLNVTGNANIANINFDNFTAEEVNADKVNSQSIENDGMISTANLTATGNVNAGTVNATDADINSLNTDDGTVTNLTSDKASIKEITDNDILSNRFITNKAYYQDINHIVSDTDYVIIEVPVFTGGIYRLSYQNPVTGEVYFNIVVNNTYDNCYFSYYRGSEAIYFDKVAIKSMKLYIKTWVNGRLFYHCDSLDTTEPPTSYGEWPIDLNELDYPLFTATRARATVYTNYVNIGMEDKEYGTAVLSVSTTNNWTLVERQRTDHNPVEYDPSNDTILYTYIPNQNVNNDADVEFNSVKTPSLTIDGINDNEYLIKRESSEALTAEAPKESSGNDDTKMDRTSKLLVTEGAIADWDGSTDRAGQAGGAITDNCVVAENQDWNSRLLEYRFAIPGIGQKCFWGGKRGAGNRVYHVDAYSFEELMEKADIVTPNGGVGVLVSGSKPEHYAYKDDTGTMTIIPDDYFGWSFTRESGTTTFNMTLDPTYSSSISHVNKIVEGEWDAGKVESPEIVTKNDRLFVDNPLNKDSAGLSIKFDGAYKTLSVTKAGNVNVDNDLLAKRNDTVASNLPVYFDSTNKLAAVSQPFNASEGKRKKALIASRETSSSTDWTLEWDSDIGGAGTVKYFATTAEANTALAITDPTAEGYIPNDALIIIGDAEQDYLKSN